MTERKDRTDAYEPSRQWISNDGYMWRKGIRDAPGNQPEERFLVTIPDGPSKGTGAIRELEIEINRARSESDYAYLDFVNAELTPAGLLKIANRFGALGVGLVHFAGGIGEPFSDWFFEVQEFQRYFKLWERVQEGNTRILRRFLAGGNQSP